jgi:signal transduction histidine kinase/CheY-like chemotaxis protein
VLVCDRDGRLLLCNQQALVLLGKDIKAQNAETWLSCCGLEACEGDAVLERGDNPLLRAIAGERVMQQPLRIRRSGQREILVAIDGTPLYDESHKIVGGIALLRDVTAQRQLEQRLAQAQKMDAVGRLAGGIAHDFNNLLSVIHCCGDNLQSELEPDDERRAEVTLMLEAAQRAAALTHQLLSFSRQQVLLPKTLQLNSAVSAMAGMLRRALGPTIALELRLADALGLVQMDASQLERIVLNLAVNARDAMLEGGSGKLELSTSNVRCELVQDGIASGDYVVLAVSDCGSGMDPATQAKMFEPFFTTKPQGKGSGLGLATVYGIVEQSGGHIRCHSALGAGTEFRIYLPRSDARASLSSQEARAPKPMAAGAGTILLVDDEAAVRRILSVVLRKLGYTVLEADGLNAARALCADETLQIDLLLTDVVMPDGSGPQLVAELCTDRPAMRAMFMSGYTDDAALLSRAVRGGAMFLQKPFSPSTLASAVADALQKQGRVERDIERNR